MLRPTFVFTLICALLLVACSSDEGSSGEVSANLDNQAAGVAVQEPNEFLDDPRWAKQKTGECLMRLEDAIKEQNADMLKQIAQEKNCQLASAAHAEHVNSGKVEPISKEDTDHDHHHHH